MTQPKFKGKYRIESTRLPDRDYAANGWYFVTICTKDCIYNVGNGVVSAQVQLTPIGEIAEQYFIDIPNHFKHTYVDAYVVMPNHVHGIVVIDKPTNLETRYINNVETRCRDAILCPGGHAALTRLYTTRKTPTMEIGIFKN